MKVRHPILYSENKMTLNLLLFWMHFPLFNLNFKKLKKILNPSDWAYLIAVSDHTSRNC